MTSAFFTCSSLRRAILAVAAISLPMWLAGCHSSDDDDDDDNPPPPVATRSIDFCRLQFPTAIDDTENATVTVFGRVFSAGVTDMTGVNDPDPAITGAVGVGPDGSDPAVDPGWTWIDGVPNPAYGPASPGYEANNDEYRADLVLPGPAGDYDFAFSFTGDAGVSFTYCDSIDGTIDGYDPALAGQLTSRSALIFREYIEGTNNNKALEIYNASVGPVDLAACEIRVYANGSAVPTSTVALVGNLASDDIIGVCHPLAGVPIQAGCSIQDAFLDFNGDDAVELTCNGASVDVIGQIGFDPGAEWSNGGVGTQDETLRRDCIFDVGDRDGSDAFDPSDQWTSFGLDDFTNFGIDHCP